MHTIASLTDYAFQPDGPVNRTKGQYRAAQHQFAVSYAETLDRPELRVDEFVRPELALYQVDPGSGKTMAYLVAAMLMIILRDKRAMICTFTRHLRDQIKGHSGHGGDAAQASDIVKQTMEENGIAHLWRPVVVEVRTSLGDVASVIIAQSIYNDSIGHERVLAGQYLAFVRDTFAAGGLPLMQDWAAMNVGLGQNPFPTINGEMVNEKGYALTPQEQMCASSEASLMVKENPSLAEIYDLITGPSIWPKPKLTCRVPTKLRLRTWS
jgi:hypothetical protein